MNEELLSFIWQYRRFDTSQLRTTEGEPLAVINPGIRNTDAGPDYLHARIRIGNTLWAGNVEIHVKSSDWFRHGHQDDAAYSNLILHVVYRNDREIPSSFSTLELYPYIDPHLEQLYRDMQNNFSDVPCSAFLPALDTVPVKIWFERLAIERLEKKCADLQEKLKQNTGHWEESFYQAMASNFGFYTNHVPFEMLAGSLPMTYLARHKNKAEDIEALLFGQAGFFAGKPSDGYEQGLSETYRFFRKKYDLEPVPVHLWKFLRLRPANFPCLRISQFSNLVYRSSHLLSAFLEAESVLEMRHLLQCEAMVYWKDHSKFGKTGGVPSLAMGQSSVDLVLVNTVIPFLFMYGQFHHQPHLVEKAIHLLSELPPEKNKIVRKWNGYGIFAVNASESQAMLHLFRNYCLKKACLQCTIGYTILKGGR